MRVLVTGASGFIGRHLTAELERQGIRIVIPGRRELGPDTDWSDALGSVNGVVHLAAVAHERAWKHQRARDYEALRRVNALGTECLARAAAHARVAHFVFVSTAAVHGDETIDGPYTETSPVAPRSLYATSKLEAERLLGAVSAETGLPVTVLRPTLVYGPGNPGNVLKLLRLLDHGLPLPFGAVRNRRSLTYVGNLTSALCAVLRNKGTGEKYLVCDATPVSTAQLIRGLANGMKRLPRLVPVPAALLSAAARIVGQESAARSLLGSLEVDCGKLDRLLGWRPPVVPEIGLVETGAWYRTRRNALWLKG